MEHPLNQELLPEKVRQATNPLLSKNRKLAVAAGVLPLAPEDNVLALYQLSFDEDKEVSSKADDTLRTMPANIVAAAVKKFPWPEPLDHIGKAFASNVEVMTTLLGNQAADNETIAVIAKKCSKDIVDVIANNQVRLTAYPKIIESIYLNKRSRMSTVDRVISFAIRNGIELEGLASFKEIAAAYQIESKPSQAAAAPAKAADASFTRAFFSGFDDASAAEAELGEEFMAFGGGDAGVFSEFDGEGQSSAGMFGEFDEAAGGAAGGGDMFSEFDQSMDREKKKKEEEEEDEGRIPLELQVSQMPISHKIRLATIGNAVHRAILLNDPNKLVALAAIKSPAISDQEVVRCSQSRSVSEDILRYIASNRDWTKSYYVKVNLVNNPKTPISNAMHFLTHMRKNDLKAVSSNKNIPNALRTQAKNMLKRKDSVKGR